MNEKPERVSNYGVPESLLIPSVDHLVASNLDIIDNFVSNNPQSSNGVPLQMVPEHYEGVVSNPEIVGEVSDLAMNKLRSFLNGTELVRDLQPYGETKYWSFGYHDYSIYVTEIRLFPNTDGAAYNASSLSAGICAQPPERLLQLMTA